MDETRGLRTWIELDRANAGHNYKVFRSLIGPGHFLMAVVKSNAYGHGLYDFALEIEKIGADWLGVDSLTEALRLRKEGIKIPILVLGYTLPERVLEATRHNISLTVSNFEMLEAISEMKFSKPLKIHIKVDTGLHRQGFIEDEREKLIEKFHSMKNIIVEGLYTHFAKAKDPNDRAYTEEQIGIFKEWVAAFGKAGFKLLIHAAATSGTVVYPESHFDIARVGIGLYGIWPSSEIKKVFGEKFKLEPVLTWKTIIAEVRSVKKGEGVGYGLSEVLSRDSRVAICPVGYWHGYPRFLSSVGEVLVGGKRAKIIGRVTMDMTMIDVTDIREAKVGSEVVLIGKQGNEEIEVGEIVEKGNGTTYDYEVLTRINPLIKKIWR